MADVRSRHDLANYPQSNETACIGIAAAGRQEKGSGATVHGSAPARLARVPAAFQQGYACTGFSRGLPEVIAARPRAQPFPPYSFSARALKFANSPGKDCSASAFSMKPGTSDESFRSMAYVASVVPGCAPGFSVQVPSLPFIISPLTIVQDSLVGRSAVCLSVYVITFALMSTMYVTSLIDPCPPSTFTFFTSGRNSGYFS